MHKIVHQHKKESPSKKCLPGEEDKSEELEPTEHSDTSVGDDCDGVFGLRRQRRLYAQVAAPAPSSPTTTQSSHNSSDDMGVDSSSIAAEAIVSAPHGRLGRTLSSLHARATGYRITKAPLPEDGAYEEEEARIQRLSSLDDQEQSSSAYQTIAVSSPLSSSLSSGDTVPAKGTRSFD